MEDEKKTPKAKVAEPVEERADVDTRETADGRPLNGVVKREDLGNGLEVVYGMHGEVSVQAKPGVTVTPELQQAAIDKSIELSGTAPEDDIRHSEHEDFMAADGSRPNQK